MRVSHRAAPVVAALALLAAPAGAGAVSLEQQAYRAGLAAYVFGYPPVISGLTADKIPAQTLISIAATNTPDNKVIVLPNVDTAYTVANLDLAAEPLVLHVPAISGRYYVFEFLDAYTNVIGYVGSRTTGTGAGDYALVGPGFAGALPAGVRRIDSPTNRIVVVGRTLVRGPGDLPAVRDIQKQYGLQPLSAYAAGQPTGPGTILDSSPGLTPPDLPAGLAFFDALGSVLAKQAPPARDRPLLDRLAKFGIGPGLTPSTASLSDAVRSGLQRAAAAGPARVDALLSALRRRSVGVNRGWVLLPKGVGAYGTRYGLRAVVAREGLWANTPDEAFYPVADQDAGGRRLDGGHRYVLRFPKGELPPARAFWSLTMYDRDLHLYANPEQRYAIGDRTAGLVTGSDGSVTLYLQHGRPAGHVANWLPAPAGRFTVSLRLYVPTHAALSGAWKPPGIARVG